MRNKHFSVFIVIVLVTTFIFSSFSCGQSESDNESSGSSSSYTPSTPTNIEESSALIYKGKTEYKIVLSSDNGNSNDSVAASELNEIGRAHV